MSILKDLSVESSNDHVLVTSLLFAYINQKEIREINSLKHKQKNTSR